MRLLISGIIVGVCANLGSFDARNLHAGIIYVNNKFGRNDYDGSAEKSLGARSGPVKTIHRALEIAKRGDMIDIANTGQPYYSTLELRGLRHSGTPTFPFRIQGNGATLDGSFAVPAYAWIPQREQYLWKFRPRRKGHYGLYLEDASLPEVAIDRDGANLNTLTPGSWGVWRGEIYYRTKKLEEPPELPLRFAVRSVGITLYDVENVRIEGVVLKNFRLDGINAHDRVHDTLFNNVTVSGCGRSGMTVSGTSRITVSNSTIRNNRNHSILIEGLAEAEVLECKLDKQPTISTEK